MIKLCVQYGKLKINLTIPVVLVAAILFKLL